MPEYDGSIVIGTNIDTNGFDNDSSKLFSKIKSLSDSINNSFKVDTTNLNNLFPKIESSLKPLDKINNNSYKINLDLFGKDQITDLNNKIQISEKVIENLKIKISELQNSVSSGSLSYQDLINSSTLFQNAIEKESRSLDKLKIKREILRSTPIISTSNEIKSIDSINSVITKINDNISGISKNSKKSFSDMNNSFKSSINAIKGNFSGIQSGLNKIFNIAKYQVLRQIIRGLIDDVKESFSDLSKYSPKIASDFQGIKDSFKNFSNSMAAAFAPIISSLAPAIIRFFNLISKIAEKIAYFNAAIFSNSNTITVANTNFKNYGKTIDKTNKSAKGLESTLAKFDKLDVLKSDKSIKIGGNLADNQFKDMFKEVEIPDWSKKLRENFQNTIKSFQESNTDIEGSYDRLFGNLGNNWNNLKSNLSNNLTTMFSNLKNNLSITFSNLKTNWEILTSNFKTNWSITFSNLKTKVYDLSSSFITLFDDIKKGDFSKLNKDIETIKTKWNDMIDGFKNDWNNMWSNLEIDISKTWSQFRNDWNKSWSQFANDWNKSWNNLVDDAKIIFKNLAYDISNVFLNIFKDMLNQIKMLLFPGLFFGFRRLNMYKDTGIVPPRGAEFRVPALASGAVVPPNRKFLAMLGDNTSESEVVSPLSTIEQAVRNVIGNGNYGSSGNVTLELDGEVFARLINPYTNSENKRVGVSMIRGSY